MTSSHELRCTAPGIPFGVLKTCEIANRADLRVAFINALADQGFSLTRRFANSICNTNDWKTKMGKPDLHKLIVEQMQQDGAPPNADFDSWEVFLRKLACHHCVEFGS